MAMQETQQYISVETAKNKYATLKSKRDTAISKVPTFSEFVNAKAQRDTYIQKIEDEFSNGVGEILGSALLQIQKLDKQIQSAKYPRMNYTSSYITDEQKVATINLLGTMEYNIAVALSTGKPAEWYPTTMFNDFANNLFGGQIDMASALAFLVLARPNPSVEFLPLRTEFQKAVNQFYTRIGAMDLMVERLELLTTQNTILNDAMALRVVGGQQKIQFGVERSFIEKQYKDARYELNL